MLEGSILQRLAAAHQEAQTDKPPLSFGVYYKNTLVALCHALEDCILSTESSPVVITAFQRGKWYLQEADRYGDLAARADQVVIMAAPEAGFAEHPTSQQSNVALVALTPDDPIAQEWHLIIWSPTYTAMVLCQELSEADYGPEGPPSEDQLRKFYGFWTFEAKLVQEVVELAIADIGRYNPQLQAKLQSQVKAIQAASSKTNPGELQTVVARVVDYLQASQQNLHPLSSHASLDDNLVSNELQAFLRMAQLIDLMDAKNPRAAAEVTAVAEMMGQFLDLPAWQIQRLRLASLLHRMGPLQSTDSVFTASKPDDYTQDQAPSCPLTCSLATGAQTLRTMPRLRAIAQIITHQTEWWNGFGQPAGLAGDDIPLESRILGLVADFQQRAASLQMPHSADDTLLTHWQNQLAAALAKCQAEQGDRWDPKLVEVLALIVSGLQQGIHLPTKLPKFTNGIWLLEPVEETFDQALKLPLLELEGSTPAYMMEEVREY